MIPHQSNKDTLYFGLAQGKLKNVPGVDMPLITKLTLVPTRASEKKSRGDQGTFDCQVLFEQLPSSFPVYDTLTFTSHGTNTYISPIKIYYSVFSQIQLKSLMDGTTFAFLAAYGHTVVTDLQI